MFVNFVQNDDFKSLIINLLGGILVILLDRLYLYLRKILKAYRFKKIFGKDIINNFNIVYGKMRLKLVYKSNGSIESHPYTKGNDKSFRISEPVAFSETKSVKYITEAIAKNTKSTPSIISDEEIKNKIDLSYCSVGGYNNDKTLDILKSGNNYYFNFDLKDTVKIISKIDTEKVYIIDKEYDYGMIIKLKNINFPNRTQICVAGLGESGTTGASWFLANKWKNVLKKAKRQDFGCIIRVKFDKDESAELIETITYNDYKRWKRLTGANTA
jgi:hypothetical protein